MRAIGRCIQTDITKPTMHYSCILSRRDVWGFTHAAGEEVVVTAQVGLGHYGFGLRISYSSHEPVLPKNQIERLVYMDEYHVKCPSNQLKKYENKLTFWRQNQHPIN
jgi:hypothetical protein